MRNNSLKITGQMLVILQDAFIKFLGCLPKKSFACPKLHRPCCKRIIKHLAFYKVYQKFHPVPQWNRSIEHNHIYRKLTEINRNWHDVNLTTLDNTIVILKVSIEKVNTINIVVPFWFVFYQGLRKNAPLPHQSPQHCKLHGR